MVLVGLYDGGDLSGGDPFDGLHDAVIGCFAKGGV